MAKAKPLIEERPVHKHQENTRLTDDGREILDSTPMAPPLGYIPQPSMMELMRMMVVEHAAAKARGDLDAETFEDSENFGEDEDDPLRSSPYEDNFDPIGEADRRRLSAGGSHLEPDDERLVQEEMARLQQTRPDPSSNPTDPVEGAAGGSPDPLPADPAGRKPVRSYWRRPPSAKPEDGSQ